MQNPSYAYNGLSPSYASVYAIALGTSFDGYKSENSEKIYAWLDFYVFVCYANNQTVQTEFCLAERNSAHVLVLQNPSYTYDESLIFIGLGPSISSVICKIRHMHITDSVRHMQVCMLLHWGPHLMGIKVKTAKKYMPGWTFMYLSATRTTRRCKQSSVWPNVTQHMC